MSGANLLRNWLNIPHVTQHDEADITELEAFRKSQADEASIATRGDNLLTHAPHTLQQVIADDWSRPYPRERAAFPSSSTRLHKVWPTVGRIDSAYGDRHLVCTCPPVEAYASQT